MKNKLRWIFRKAIRFRGRYLRSAIGFPYPAARPRSIAYFVGGGIGDAVMTCPALCLLKCTFPDARLDVFVPPKPFPVLEHVLAQFEPRVMPRPVPFSPSLRRHYDIAFSNTVAAFYLAVEFNAFSCARRSFGFRYPDEEPHSRLYDATQPIADGVHDIDQNSGLIARALHIQLDVSQVGHPHAQRLSVASDAAVLIHPGVETGYDYKLWPLDRYGEIVSRLASKEHNVKVLLGPAEAYMRNSFTESDRVKILIAPSAGQLVEEIKNARLFAGNDSGPAHLAAFYGVPGVTLIGPVNPARTAPRGSNSLTIHNEIECSPCHFKKEQCRDNKCMKSISVEQVWTEIEKLL